MAVSSALFVNKQEIIDVIDQIAKELAPDVIFIGFSIADDWMGKPSLFFRVLLSDEASRFGIIRKTANRVEKLTRERLQPEQRWDLHPFFDYRSKSEQADLQDPAWEGHAIFR